MKGKLWQPVWRIDILKLVLKGLLFISVIWVSGLSKFIDFFSLVRRKVKKFWGKEDNFLHYLSRQVILDRPVPAVQEVQAASAATAMEAVHIPLEFHGEISLPLETLNSQTCHTSILAMVESRRSQPFLKELQNLPEVVSVLLLLVLDSKNLKLMMYSIEIHHYFWEVFAQLSIFCTFWSNQLHKTTVHESL